MAELTNTYTQIKNIILLRNKYKILSFKPTEVDLYKYNSFLKIPINESFTDEQLDDLVNELNQSAITCVCEDNSNQEENC